MSIALIANAAIPSTPYQYACAHMRSQWPSASCASPPTTSGAKPSSTSTCVARVDSGNWEMASPQPTVPSSAATRTSVMQRRAPR